MITPITVEFEHHHFKAKQVNYMYLDALINMFIIK